MSHEAPLILTLDIDHTSFALLDTLRRQHFPPARNLVPAHVTLFHALPGAQEPAIVAALQATCAASVPPPLAFPSRTFSDTAAPDVMQARL